MEVIFNLQSHARVLSVVTIKVISVPLHLHYFYSGEIL